MTATRITNPYVQYLDDVGEPLAAGTLTIYENRTTNLASIYSDAALTTPQDNPYTLNSLGQVAGDIFINETVTVKVESASGGFSRSTDDVNVDADADAIINLLAAKGCAFTYSDVVSAGYTITAGNTVRGSNGNTYKYNSGSVVDPVTDTPYDQDSGLSNSGAWTDIVIANAPVTPSSLTTIESDISTLESDFASLEGQVSTPDFFQGCEISNNASGNKLDISSGSVMDSTNAVRMVLSSALTKSTSNWAEGDDAGGFPSTLTIATSTFYRVFLLAKADGTVDAGFDSLGNTSAAALLNDATGYVYYRQAGFILTDSSTATTIEGFIHVNGHYFWNTRKEDRSPSTLAAGAHDIALSAPPDSLAYFSAYINTNHPSANNAFVVFSDVDNIPATADNTNSDMVAEFVTGQYDVSGTGNFVRKVNSSSEVGLRLTSNGSATDTVGISTIGYIWSP